VNATRPTTYAVRVRGHLADRWSAQLDGFALTRSPDGTTTLTGRPVDQAALHGLLHKIRDLGLDLLSVTPAPDDPTSATTTTGSPS
jgi:hypothetical protein